MPGMMKKKKINASDLNNEALLRLDSNFIKVINKLLLKDGPDKIKSEKIINGYLCFFILIFKRNSILK